MVYPLVKRIRHNLLKTTKRTIRILGSLESNQQARSVSKVERAKNTPSTFQERSNNESPREYETGEIRSRSESLTNIRVLKLIKSKVGGVKESTATSS